MPTLSSFSLPAFIQDFPDGSPEDKDLKARWNLNVSGWITQAMPAAPAFFYDPLSTDIPQGTLTVLVQWVAFPGRLKQFYSSTPPNQPANPYNLSQEQVYSLADQYAAQGSPPQFQQIPATLCPQADWSCTLKTFGPYGPRGWLDEYCEWSAARDANGNLLRVDFACENPEYWNTLWQVSPETVRSLYECVLNWDVPADRQISVQLEDLKLFYQGEPVLDPFGAPVYNPLNQWNTGPTSVRTGDASQFSGGVMHLTSTPNTLQTELGLAGASTVQYQPPGGQINEQTLICCGNYGQEYRHSDPHIGYTVNQVVAGALTGGTPQLVCLANPVGLYLQSPLANATFAFGPGIDPSRLPGGAQASDVYQVLRGAESVNDPVTGQDFPGNMILHAMVQIPSAWLAVYPNMTLGDILINLQPIQWAGQVAEQFFVGLYARPVQASSTPPAAACASTATTPGAPLQALYHGIWDAFYNTVETAPTGQTMSLASNTTFIAPWLPQGATIGVVLTCNTPSPGTLAVSVLLADGSGPDTSILVKVDRSEPVTYAVPGNSYPGSYTALYLEVEVPTGTPTGLRGMQIVDPQSGAQSYPAMVYISGGIHA
jgi:hypothetical protein